MMDKQQPRTIRRMDYAPPPYWVDSVDLRFELGDTQTLVYSTLQLHRNEAVDAPQPLHLVGERMELVELVLNGVTLGLGDYLLSARGLTINQVPDQCELKIVTRLEPHLNTALEGLYRSGDMFCTQCEAEGFRRITYYPDRPDVMARFTTTIVADKAEFPILLSNGNLVERGELDDGRHWVRWEDPYPKPSYLFALVAGDLGCLEDRYTTRSGREVTLRVYTEHDNVGQTEHAMESLKRAMAWDEEAYGLEYDLDIYMIVAVGDFNMGAMENKGLNVFNTQYVLASPQTSTDTDFENVEAVIGHEYFHNWTGNRVTCRDWFQLSLKEGLTVFREQQFSAAMGSAAVKRINDVRILRTHQFPEDAGPMAHPVRPDQYAEINNFYTTTIYNKGAELIRMYHTLLGEQGFQRGLKLYFERHDGQAVTCDDFLAAMADANDVDLTQFGRWYSQAGTPVVAVEADYDAAAQTYTLTLRQSCAPTPGQPRKEPFHMPITVALIGPTGAPLVVAREDDDSASVEHVLELRENEQRFTFRGVAQRPVPSLLRGFSAPVHLEFDYTPDDLAFLFAHDDDPFSRWEAGQRLMVDLLLSWLNDGRGPVPAPLLKAVRQTLADTALDPAFVAEALTPPSEAYLAEQVEIVDPQAIHEAREHLRGELANHLAELWDETYRRLHALGETADAGQRRLRNRSLDYLAARGQADSYCQEQHRGATNMTDKIAALSLRGDTDSKDADAGRERRRSV